MSMIGADPNSFTKERLKLELRNNGVAMPSPDSRKDVYVKLYQTHVLSKKQSEFSSDDESISNTPKRKKKPLVPKGKVTKETMPATLGDVTSLSDADLAAKLRALGVDVGPILDSTRKVYQRKLERLLSESVRAEPAPVKSPSPKKSPARPSRSRPVPKPQEEPEEEEFSDQDETDSALIRQTEAEEELQRRLENLRRRPLAKDSPSSNRTRAVPEPSNIRPEPPVIQSVEPEEEEKEEMNHFTPQEDVTNNTQNQNHVTVTPAKPTRRVAIWIQVAVLIVVAILIFLVIQNLEPAKKSIIGSIDSQ